MLVDSGSEAMMMSEDGSRSPGTSEEGRGPMFACTMCSYRTDRKNNLKRHTLTMHEVSPAPLECCGLRFLNKAELRMHTHKFHRDGYHCDMCSRVFCRKALLKRHYSVHSGYKEFSCQHCTYQTSHKSNLERHMRVHQKNGGPLPRHLLEAAFLPELSQPNVHFSSKISLHQTFLPGHPMALFPGHPGGANLYQTASGGPPWSTLASLSPAATFTPSPATHTPGPRLAVASPATHTPGPRLAKAVPCSFSVSALLGEDLLKQEGQTPEARSWTASASLHPPPHDVSWRLVPEGGPPPPAPPITHAHTSAAVLRPTPIHALDLTRGSTSAEMCYGGDVQTTYWQPSSWLATDGHQYHPPTPPRGHTPYMDHQWPGSDWPTAGGECQEVDSPLNLKVHLQPQPLLLHQQYVPKKLRVSKKFKDMQKDSGEVM